MKQLTGRQDDGIGEDGNNNEADVVMEDVKSNNNVRLKAWFLRWAFLGGLECDGWSDSLQAGNATKRTGAICFRNH